MRAMSRPAPSDGSVSNLAAALGRGWAVMAEVSTPRSAGQRRLKRAIRTVALKTFGHLHALPQDVADDAKDRADENTQATAEQSRRAVHTVAERHGGTRHTSKQ